VWGTGGIILIEGISAAHEVKVAGILLYRNAQLQAKRSRGFHPRRCGSPDAITPEQVLRHHRSAQGRHGGTGSCPLLHSYQHPEFHIHGKGILQSPFFDVFKRRFQKKNFISSYPDPVIKILKSIQYIYLVDIVNRQ
jgi:hypothetical protein